MVDLADKVERHEEGILNGIKFQANSAKSESTNTVIHGLIGLAKGFRNIGNMMSLIYLKCSDLVINLFNRPQPSAAYTKARREKANERRKQREEQKRAEYAMA